MFNRLCIIGIFYDMIRFCHYLVHITLADRYVHHNVVRNIFMYDRGSCFYCVFRLCDHRQLLVAYLYFFKRLFCGNKIFCCNCRYCFTYVAYFAAGKYRLIVCKYSKSINSRHVIAGHHCLNTSHGFCC